MSILTHLLSHFCFNILLWRKFYYGSVFVCDRNTDLSNCPELLLSDEDPELGEEEKELLDIYHHSFNDENIDMDLLMTLLCDIHASQDKGKSARNN